MNPNLIHAARAVLAAPESMPRERDHWEFFSAAARMVAEHVIRMEAPEFLPPRGITADQAGAAFMALQDIDRRPSRIDIIGQNGNTGEHYGSLADAEHGTSRLTALDRARIRADFDGECG